MWEFIIGHYNYWMYVLLMMIGFYAMMVKRNLIKKIIGMNIFQSAIIFFFISMSVKGKGIGVPILRHHSGAGSDHTINVLQYANPLPHVLMLTAIVVMVATLGVALAVIIMIHQEYNSIEEDEITARFEEESKK